MINGTAKVAPQAIDPVQLAQYEKLYGRNLTSIEAIIVHKWNLATDKPRVILNYPDIPQEKLKNALQNFANAVAGDLILGLRDATVLGSGKKGILFTTGGLIWRLIGDRSATSVRYDELDPDRVSYTHSESGCTLDLTEEHKLPFPLDEEGRIITLWMFIRDAIRATPAKKPDDQTLAAKSEPPLPEMYWEFLSEEGGNRPLRRYMSLDEVKKAFTLGQIQTNDLYRKCDSRTTNQRKMWMLIPDELYEELGLSKEAVVRAEKRRNRLVSVGCTFLAVVAVAGVAAILWYFVQNIPRTPQGSLNWGMLGYRLFGILGIVAGLYYLFRRYRG